MKLKNGEQQSESHSRRNAAIGFVIGMLLGGLIDLFMGDRGIATVLGMILGTVIGYRGLHQVDFMEYPPGAIRNLVITGTLFFTVLLGSIYMISDEISRSLQIVLALAPSIPGFFFILALGNAISNLDEFQRRIQAESIAIGFGLTALITMTYGLLGLTGTPQANWLFVTFIMVFSWLAGKLWLRWKYR